MYTNGNSQQAIGEYKKYEIQLHRELINSCRRYIGKLNIVSIIGILELVKHESIEIEYATKLKIEKEEKKILSDNL
jgi:hypothetical protein